MAVKLLSSGGGSVTIADPASTANNFTLNPPLRSGQLAVDGPAFSAYPTSNSTTFTASTFVKVTLDAEEFDTNSNFVSSRFTPTVAGYYQISGGVSFASTTGLTLCALFKNGVRYKDGSWTNNTAGQSVSVVTSVVYLNGSTDYVELYGYSGTSTITNNNGGTIYGNYLNGALVRAA